MRKERKEEKNWKQIQPQMDRKQKVFVSSPFKIQSPLGAQTVVHQTPRRHQKIQKNQENLKDLVATGNTNFNNSNLTAKANNKMSQDQNQ